MSKQTISLDKTELEKFLEDYSTSIAGIVARDPDVVLSNSTMEGTSSIAIATWAEVEKTILHFLKVTAFDLQNRSSLTFPCPKNIYDALYLMMEQKITDNRGTVRLLYQLDAAFLPGDINVSSVQALFGRTGYFSRTYGSYTGTSYLDGTEPRVPEFLLAKQGPLAKGGRKNDSPILTIVKRFPVGKAPISITSTSSAGTIFIGQDGFDVHTSAMHQMLPENTPVEKTDTDLLLSGRLTPIGLHAGPPRYLRARLLSCWTMVKGHRAFVRSLFSYKVNTQMQHDLTRTVLNAETLSGITDMPGELTLWPSAEQNCNISMAALLYMNPMLPVFTTAPTAVEFNAEQLHTLTSVLASASAPITLSESLRSHKWRYLTYDEDTYSGMIFAYPADSLELIGVPSTRADTFVSQDLSQISRQMRGVLSACSTISSAPMVSIDNNTIPISIKYIVNVFSKQKDDNTSVATTVRNEPNISGNAILRLAQRMVGADNKALISSFADAFFVGTSANRTNFIDALEKALKKLEPDVDELTPQEDTMPSSLTRAIRTTLNGGLSDPNFPASEVYKNPDGLNSDGAWYVFTKFKNREIIRAAEKFQYALFFPVVTTDSDTPHTLVVNGYTKVARLYDNPCEVISTSSLKDRTTGTPRTEYGVILTTLARQGGFGFLSQLGPLVGGLGSIIGNAVGVPEIGQVAGAVGQIGGQLLGGIL